MFDQLANTLSQIGSSSLRTPRKSINENIKTEINTSSENLTWFSPSSERLREITDYYNISCKGRRIPRYVCVVWRTSDGKVTVFPTAGLAAKRLKVQNSFAIRAAMRNPYQVMNGYQFAAYFEGMSLECPPVTRRNKLRVVMLHAHNKTTRENRFFSNWLTVADSLGTSDLSVRVAVACHATIPLPTGDWIIQAATLKALKQHYESWIPKDYYIAVANTPDYNDCIRTNKYAFCLNAKKPGDLNAAQTYRRLLAEI